MTKDTEQTLVIFRRFNDGDIIALFPCETGDSSPRTCESYMHVGQHGSADPSLIESTKPATPTEYAMLKSELEYLDYNLKVIKRNQRRFYNIRRAKLEQIK